MDTETVKREFETITAKTTALLNKQESYDVDFKVAAKGVHPDDFVSFANTVNGGTILIGVEEIIGENGQQRGKIIGCETNDETKLSFINKAMSCRPPIDIEIFVENISSNSIYRIEIPSGKYKPYCTSKGEYLIRSDGRNTAITQDKLLDIFLEKQGQVFIERFKAATRELSDQLQSTKKDLSELNTEIQHIRQSFTDEIKNITDNIDSFSKSVESNLKNIFDASASANSLSDEAMNFSENTLLEVQKLREEISNKIDILLKKI
jgi:predicted HTH transcriptional regulator